MSLYIKYINYKNLYKNLKQTGGGSCGCGCETRKKPSAASAAEGCICDKYSPKHKHGDIKKTDDLKKKKLIPLFKSFDDHIIPDWYAPKEQIHVLYYLEDVVVVQDVEKNVIKELLHVYIPINTHNKDDIKRVPTRFISSDDDDDDDDDDSYMCSLCKGIVSTALYRSFSECKCLLPEKMFEIRLEISKKECDKEQFYSKFKSLIKNACQKMDSDISSDIPDYMDNFKEEILSNLNEYYKFSPSQQSMLSPQHIPSPQPSLSLQPSPSPLPPQIELTDQERLTLTQIYNKNKDAPGTLGDEIIKYIKKNYGEELEEPEFFKKIEYIINKFIDYNLDTIVKLQLLKSPSSGFDKKFLYSKYDHSRFSRPSLSPQFPQPPQSTKSSPPLQSSELTEKDILSKIYNKNKNAIDELGDEIAKYIIKKYGKFLNKQEFIKNFEDIVKKFEEYKLDKPENLLKSHSFDIRLFYHRYSQVYY
jgi:hypothetical protein